MQHKDVSPAYESKHETDDFCFHERKAAKDRHQSHGVALSPRHGGRNHVDQSTEPIEPIGRRHNSPATIPEVSRQSLDDIFIPQMPGEKVAYDKDRFLHRYAINLSISAGVFVGAGSHIQSTPEP